MRKLVYEYKEREKDILYAGTVEGRVSYIVYVGTHPCVYVDANEYTEEELSNYLEVHGGVTFYGPLDYAKSKHNFVGWDYAHLGDYRCLPTSIDLPEELADCFADNRKYTTEELYEELTSAVKQLNNHFSEC